MADLATVSKADLAKQNKSLRGRLNSIRSAASKGNEQMIGVALSGAGGALAGVLQSKYPNIAKTGVDGALVVGGGIVVLALLDQGGKQKENMLQLGSGIIGGAAAIRTWKAFEKKAGRNTF